MTHENSLSVWWRIAVVVVMIIGFAILGFVAARSYSDAPPIPGRVVGPSGAVLFTASDIEHGQEVFLKYGLMENGTIWGHGAYLGPDFSATYLHNLVLDCQEAGVFNVQDFLKDNRYDSNSDILVLTDVEAKSFERQTKLWQNYFAAPAANGGLKAKLITDPNEIRDLTAFFSWTAWSSVARRPGFAYSYTNNFPYDPQAGNVPTVSSYVWSALSLIALLAGTGFVLFAFGKFNFLGWRRYEGVTARHMSPGQVTQGQKAAIKYFVVVSFLFLLQAFVGGLTAHYRADPGTFFGVDISSILPSNIARTWHLQLALFWIATSYVAGALVIAPSFGGDKPNENVNWINFLFVAVVVVTIGSLLGEYLGVNRALGQLWFWFGHQGWEYLDLGRAWQIVLVLGFVIWIILLKRCVAPGGKSEDQREMATLFMLSAAAIPLFYLPAMFFGSKTNFTIVDNWRFWIIHLWVEGFFELFVTTLVAVMFYQLGIVSRVTATRVIYLDAILYLGAGIVGTGHHWYWTGQSTVNMALSSTFSAMEVVPLTLLTLDAWDFIRLGRTEPNSALQDIVRSHRWTFYFLMAVGFWNFIGAGIFGFLINLPIISYFEVGTLLTPNHGHAAMMGVFGMLAVALMVFSLRHVSNDAVWGKVERYIKISFLGLNVGLALMAITNLFPGGVFQFLDVIENGYWHARSLEFLSGRFMNWVEWARLPGDLIFIVAGVAPLVYASLFVYRSLSETSSDSSFERKA